MLSLMWLVSAIAIAVPAWLMAVGFVTWRRDFFALFLYLQIVVYMHLAPLVSAYSLPADAREIYARFQVVSLVLLDLPFLLLYGWWRRRTALLDDRRPVLRFGRAVALAMIGASLGVGYWFVALRNGLVYRRIGSGLGNAQLGMSLPELAVYRSFMELGPLVIALQFYALRRAGTSQRRVKGILLAGCAITLGLYLGYALVNSRQASILIIALLTGLWALTLPAHARARWRMVSQALLIGLIGTYVLSVARNVREAAVTGEEVLDATHLIPGGGNGGRVGTPLWWRLNGLDLIATIAPNVEREGPAWGTAWVLPFLVSLDPIVRTDLTVQLKEAALTNAKSFLLLRYAGIGVQDYFSAIVSDAYGNLGRLGFLVIAIVLAFLTAWTTNCLQGHPSRMRVVICLFALTRVLAFEQQFATLLFGWFKLFPLALGIGVWYPLEWRGAQPESIDTRHDASAVPSHGAV